MEAAILDVTVSVKSTSTIREDGANPWPVLFVETGFLDVLGHAGIDEPG